MAILNNNPLVGASGNQGGYNINNSLRFRSSASAYLNRTPASAGNRRTFTWSAWIKRGSITANSPLFSVSVDSANFTLFRFGPGTTDKLEFYTLTSSVDYSEETVALFRDPSAWYHIVLSVDTTQATAGNRVRIYVNGVQQTTTQFYGQVPQNYDTFIDTTNAHNICRNTDTTTQHFDGYLADVNFIDGSAKTPSDFGETDTTTGVWKPKAYSGTYGTNGFYLKFSDIATTSGSNAGLGKDFSGNSNYWTTNNISVTAGTTYDAMTDSPTNTSATVANYAVINPLDVTTATISNANLTMTSTSAAHRAIRASIGISSGKWYWEQVFTGASQNGVCGVGTNTASLATYVGGDANSWGYYSANGLKYNNGSGTSYGATYAANDIIGIAFDADAGTLVFYKNNVSQGTAYTLTTGVTYYPMLSQYNSDIWNINFGQRPFTYTPPTGFVALNTFNLPTPTILQGNKYMDATLYTGDGASPRSITNTASFKPDLVWVKSRSNAEWNILFDSVRGTGKSIYSNDTAAEVTNAANGYVSAFNSNGYSVTAGSSGSANVNASAYTYVGWQWQAGQGSTSSNTSGSITSTVSVNTTAGFSVVTYTGTGANATVGHGLGVAPRLIICKNRASATDWAVYHASFGNTGALRLNSTIANEVDSRYWNNTTPTSTVFTVGSSSTVNGSSNTQVAYCFAEIAGFSRFGSYVANASSDGPFIYTGFRPRWIMFKRTTSATNWYVIDTSISPINASTAGLYPNTADAVSTEGAVDILSNGFKCRVSSGAFNFPSGETFAYVAFAENPFKNALAR